MEFFYYISQKTIFFNAKINFVILNPKQQRYTKNKRIYKQ